MSKPPKKPWNQVGAHTWLILKERKKYGISYTIKISSNKQ